MTKINISKRVAGVLPVNNGGINKVAANMVTKKKGFVRINATEDGYDFAGIFDQSATVTLVSGYNNDVALPAGSNNIMVNGVFGKPAIITGISSTGRSNGEVITLRNNGATFLLAMSHLKETSVASSAIYPAGASVNDTIINYVPVCRGQQATLYYAGGWYLMNATELLYSIPMKKGVSYTQQSSGGGNIGNIAQFATGGSLQANSTPSVGMNQSLSILNTGNTATGRVSLFTGGAGVNLQQYALGNNLIETHFMIVAPVNSTATQRYNLRLGLLNSTTAPTVGIWASYRDDENGGNWTFKCNNGGTVTVVNTTLGLFVNSLYLFSIIWNGHEAKLIQGGVVLATIPAGTLNFPTTQGCTPMLSLEKIVGTTASVAYFGMCGLVRVETTM